MSIPSSRASFAFLITAGAAAVALTAGLACKKNDPAAEPPTPTTAAANAPAAATPLAPARPGVLGKGVIRGNAHFMGKAPEAHAITTPDPFCAKQGIKDEDLMVGPGGGLKNVLVRVTRGATGNYDAARTDAVVDQSGCMYRPRVQFVMAGQTVQIKNSDQTLHNVHTYRGASTLFNQAQIPGMGPMSKTFSDGGQIIKFKCDVHPWMTGYVGVASNPFFAVTADDGSFSIEKLPAGTYTVEAWHERLGNKTAEVTVTEAEPAKAAFDFALP